MFTKELTMKKVQVAAAEGTSSDLEDDISRLDELRPRGVDDLHLVFALPYEGFHGLTAITGLLIVGHILLGDGAAIVANDLFGLVRCLRDGHCIERELDERFVIGYSRLRRWRCSEAQSTALVLEAQVYLCDVKVRAG